MATSDKACLTPQTQASSLIPVMQEHGEAAPAFPLARITTCGRLAIETLSAIHASNEGQMQAVYGPPDPALLARKGTSTALILLALLVSQPGCFASKDWLSEKLGRGRELEDEEEEESEGLKRVDNVVSRLRSLLLPGQVQEQPAIQQVRRHLVEYRRASGESGPGYQLAGMPWLWLDVTEIEAHIKRARRLEQFGHDGLAEWRAAYDLAMEGRFLPGEVYSDWAEWRRQQIETHLWDSVQVLWHRAAEQGESGGVEALRILRAYWQSHPTNEDALRPLLELLGKHECFGEAQTCYDRLCAVLADEGRRPDQRTADIIEFLQAVQLRRNHLTANPKKTTQPSPNLLGPLSQHETHIPFSAFVPQSIMLSHSDSGEPHFMYSRRHMISGMLTTAYTLLTLSPYMLLFPEKQEPFLATIQEKAVFQQAIVDDLGEITQNYWKLSANASLSLFDSIQGHFQTIMHLLNAPHGRSLHRELLSLASQAAQLLGKTLVDLCDYSLALSYYTFAVKAALEAQQYDLWAVALGRLSLLFLSVKQPRQALSCLQEIPGGSLVNNKIRAWCTAIEAEAYSSLGYAPSCLDALERTRDASEEAFLVPDVYATGFTRSRLASYEGSCYLRLHLPERALPALQQAMALIDPGAIRKRSRLLTYMGEAHALLGETQQAYTYAHQALDLTQHTQSLDILRQVQALSRNLSRGKTSLDDSSLYQRIQEMQLVFAGMRG